MNRRRLMTGVHLKGRVVLVDDFPADGDRNLAFFWTPNNTDKTINTTYDCGDYLDDLINGDVPRIYIPIDSEGRFDYYYDKYVYSLIAAFAWNTNIKEIYFEEIEGFNNCTNFNMLFAKMSQCQVMDFDIFGKCNINSVYGMFWGINELKRLDLSALDLSKCSNRLSWQNRLISNGLKLTYLNWGNFWDKGIIDVYYQFQNLGRDADENIIIDNFFNKKLATVPGGYYWQNAFNNINMDVIDFRNMDFTPLNDLTTTGINISDTFGKTKCRKIYFPDTPFRIINEYYTFGSGSGNGNLEYVDFGRGVFRADPSVDITGSRLYYIFTYLPNLNKIRCVQDCKDVIIKRTVEDNAPTFLPSKFTTDDSLWEIIE